VDRQDVLASAVRDASAQVVQGGRERQAATEISLAERRVAQRLWDVRAREDLHARRVAEDSNLVWEQTSL
jgi:hypothetical protein